MTASRRARVLGLLIGAALWLGAPPCGAGPQQAKPRAQARPPAEQAKPAAKPYKPEVGQAGKDVIWVPTADTMVAQMLDMAKVTRHDYLIDLGSGDGRTVIAAARRGIRAHGIEYNPNMVALSQKNADAARVEGLATFERGDLFQADLSKASVITMFLMPWINMKLRPTLLGLRPGTRIVSNTFTMEDWSPDESVQVADQCQYYCTALLWIVPARVEGTWQVSPGRLSLTQQFQKVSGTLGAWGRTRPITGGRLRGDRLAFSVAGADYEAVVKGDLMEGTVTTRGKRQPFRAKKIR